MINHEVITGVAHSKVTQPLSSVTQGLSVIIISYNEEKNIGRCIDSVKKIADEIILLDSYSTDRTVAIAKSKGVIVKQSVFNGHIEQKNRALELSSHNLVLSLDADEALSRKLAESILAVKKQSHIKAYRMNRCTSYCGKFIRHGLWYPDRKVRLFDKRTARWGGVNPHDKVVLAKDAAVIHLKGDILHYSYNTIAEHLLQNNYFSSVSAQALYEKGKRFQWWKVFVNPLWSFINGYFLRAGFMDGMYGFIIAINSSHYTFLKYIKLHELQRKNRNKPR
jgi:glycosyltransferase involved in cell wall biosynthesis